MHKKAPETEKKRTEIPRHSRSATRDAPNAMKIA
jgi:hypothetical protein